MTDIDEHGRREPPLAGDETATLVGYLDYQRATLEWKCARLDTAALNATVAASSMTLGGMLKHLAYVEEAWFSWRLRGTPDKLRGTRSTGRPTRTGTGTRQPTTPPEQLWVLWRDTVAWSRGLLAEALADDGLDQLCRRTLADGRTPSLRWVLCHMVEEYARHNGHADLLRESLDGVTGE